MNHKRQIVDTEEYNKLYNLANKHKIKKEYAEALDIYSSIISKRENESECVECAKLFEDVGDIYFELKDFQRAFEFFQKALHIYAENNKYDLQLNQYKKIGTLQQGIWQFKKSADIYKQGLSLSIRLGLQDRIIDFELLLGNVLNWADELIDSEKYLLGAIEKEKVFSNSLIKLRAHVSYAILLRKMKKYKLADKYFKLGMKISKENNDAYLLDISKSYGIMQFEIGNYDEAERLLLEAEEKAEYDGNDTTKAVIFEYLSLLFEHKKDFSKAFYYIKKFYENKLELLERGYSEDNNLLQIKLGLEDAKRERMVAEETATAKNLFIATISHEIRTPMNIILGTSSLMLNDNPKQKHVKYLQILKQSGENLLGIINDILDVSKIEAGRLEMESEPVNLKEICDNTINILEYNALEKKLNLQLFFDEKIDFPILSDGLRLSQILTNLINNAIKFTEKGTIRCEVTLKNKNKIQIIISDTGIGIPKNKIKTIFDQYQQVRTKVENKYKGTGLGLTICKKLVEMMNGTIQLKSKINVGTSFIISLPFEKAVLSEKLHTISKLKDTSFLENKTILIADDFEDNRFIFKESLLYFCKKIHILEAKNGKEALEMAKLHQPDLILMDLDMPEMNGVEALTKIRKIKKMQTVKVVASTASLISNDEDEFYEIGFDGYLPKPFNIDQFFNLLVLMISSK